jgi:hypothetical protein
MEQNLFSIEDLCKRFNITKRTIYYYMSIGLIPPAGKRGRGNQYNEDFAQKLEHVLRYRGKMKLSQIPHSDAMNFSFRNPIEYSVMTIRITSNNHNFARYAFDAIGNEATKIGLSCSDMIQSQNQNLSTEAMLVLFPVNQRSIASMKMFAEGLRQVASTYDGGVSYKVYISDEPFMSVIEENTNA